MARRVILAVALAMLAAAAAPREAETAVFCKKKKGTVFARDACKAKETQLNLADFGAVGPPGPPGPATGPAGGDLTGNYPNPTIGDAKVTTSKLADGSVTSAKLAGSEPTHLVGAVGEPAFENGWTNFGAIFSTAGFYKDPLGIVHLRGFIAGGTITADAFTLPSDYRPALSTFFAVVGGGNAFADVVVQGPGNSNPGGVFINVGDNGFISLDGITFRAGD